MKTVVGAPGTATLPDVTRATGGGASVNQHRVSSGLPTTAYVVLGVLAATSEQLTAGEIKTRAELYVGYFYWSPSVSHVRRELDRLLARDMVNEVSAESGKRTITLYEATAAGLEALRRWVAVLPGPDQLVIKHPIILKIWLADGVDTERLLEMVDQHIAATRARLDLELWSRERAHELGMTDDPALRFQLATLNYAIRGLYAELSNIQQLRDEIARGTAEDPVRRVARPKGQLRRRT